MKSILEELYNGNIYINELIVPKEPRYRTLNKKISDMMNSWKQKLSPEEYDQLEKLLDLRSEVTSMETSESFVYGFKMGALIMMQILDRK